MAWGKKPHVALKQSTGFPATEYGEVTWDDFSGGKNSRFPSTQIERNEAQDCRDVYTDLRKALVKRPGYALFATADGSDVPTTIWPYYKVSAAGVFTRFLLKAASTKVRYWDGASWADAKTGLTSGLRFGYAEANNKAYFANGTDGLLEWNNTGAAAAVAAAPAGTWALMWHRNRMWTMTFTSSRAYFSDLGDPTAWPVLNFIDFDTDDGDKLTAMISLPDGAALFFKERSRHLLRGSGPGNFSTFSYRDGIGCVCPWAVTVAGETHEAAFLGRTGVYLTNGTSLALISDHITPDIRGWSQAYLTKASLDYYNFHLHVSVPNATADAINTRTWVYDVRAKSWWPWSIQSGHLTRYFDGTTLFLLGISTTTGKVFKLWTGTNDDGAAISAYWKGKDDACEDSTRRKRYKRGFVTEKAYEGTHDVTVTWNQDFGTSSASMTVPVNMGTFPVFDVAAFNVDSFVSSEGVVDKGVMVATESAYVRPEVYQSGIDTPFAILKLVLETKLTNRRVGVVT